MIKRTTAILLIITIGIIYSCGTKKIPPGTDTYPYTEQVEPTRAEQVMRAIYEAYPQRIEKVEFRNDDWAVLMRKMPKDETDSDENESNEAASGKTASIDTDFDETIYEDAAAGEAWYYFAGGKMLPQQQLKKSDSFRSYQFYNYPDELPPWRRRSYQEVQRFRTWSATRSQNTLRRASYFHDDLWQGKTRTEIEKHIVRVSFLGRNIRIHQWVQENFERVEEQITAAGENDPVVQNWIDTLRQPSAFEWRTIADTQSRSYHSYGIAVDLLPVSLGRLQAYWLWTIQHRDDWWNVPYSERYHPPAAVIKAFESNGFIWGGKWPLFDTMHFEYRPEILILNGLLPALTGN